MTNKNENEIPTIRESLGNLILEARNLKVITAFADGNELLSSSKRLRQLGSHAGYLLNKAENTAKKMAWEDLTEDAQNIWLSKSLNTI